MKPTTRQAGFSLIEVMLVLVIIGIATASISISLSPDPAQTLRQDAQDLALRLQVAQHEVRTDGRLLVWQPNPDGYSFKRGTWLLPDPRSLPRVSTVKLDDFSQDELLKQRSWRTPDVQVEPPGPLVLTSEWMPAPAVVTLQAQGHVVQLINDGTGAFQVSH